MTTLNKKNRIVALRYPPQAGFTLIELIMVIVLLGILGVMGANFIGQTFKGFSDTDARMEIYEEGTAALLRMERELRNAVPNAVNPASAVDLQFGLIDETAMACAVTPCVFGQYTDNNPAGKSFIRDRTLALPAGAILSIYNLDWDGFSSTNPALLRSYHVDNTVAVRRMNLDRNINAASPGKRYYAVDKAVRYYLFNGALLRSTASVANIHAGGGITFPADAAGHPLAKDITALQFSYQAGSQIRNALVSIEFTIMKNNESVNFHKEIVIRNVP